MNQPAYIRIANDLRNRIATGDLTPGTRLPARQELAAAYQAAEGVVREATQLLLREGLLVSKPGAGTYVRERPQPRLLVRSWFRDRQDGSPFGPAIAEQGRHGSLEYTSDTMQAPAEIRERLGLPEADGHRHDVMRTAYVFSTKDEGPWMLLTSWEPLALTKGTPIAFPEGGEFASQGVPRRMASIGLMVDAWDERVSARVATRKEAKQLGIGAGSVVMVVERAHLAGDRVVEVADIVVPAESTMLAYNGPVGDSAPTS